MKKSEFTISTTQKMAQLSKLKIGNREKKYLTKQLNETIKTIEVLNNLNTKGIQTTYQVTGLRNVFREDKIDEKRILTQEQALKNSKRTFNGYFVVKRILK